MTAVAAGLSARKNDLAQSGAKKDSQRRTLDRSASSEAIQGVWLQMSCPALVRIDNRSSLGIQDEPVGVWSVLAEVEHVVQRAGNRIG
jgi:hypothetical protein